MATLQLTNMYWMVRKDTSEYMAEKEADLPTHQIDVEKITGSCVSRSVKNAIYSCENLLLSFIIGDNVALN